MSDDHMMSLRAAKPVNESNELLEPAVLERVRAAALSERHGAATPVRAPRHRRTLTCVGVAATVMAAGTAILLVLPGGSVSPSEALAHATQRTAEFTSGRIVWTIAESFHAADGVTQTDRTIDVRYDRNDFAIGHRLTQTTPGSTSPVVEQGETGAVDGRSYTRNHGQGSPIRLDPDSPAATPGRLSGSADALAIQRQYMDALADAVRAGTDVTSQTREDMTTYTTTLSTDAFTVPAGVGVHGDRATAPRLVPLLIKVRGDRATLEVAVQNGVVRSFAIDNGRGYHLRAEITDLGKPQAITAR